MSFAAFGLGALAQGAGSSMNLGTNMLQGAINNYWHTKSASTQYHYTRKFTKNSPSWQVEGLRKAGLNPILAAGGGFSPSSWSPSAAPSASVSPKDVNILQGLQVKQLEQQNRLLESQVEGQEIKNENDRKNRGLTGKFGAISRVISEGQEVLDKKQPQINKWLQDSNNRPRSSKEELAREPDVTDDEYYYNRYKILREKYPDKTVREMLPSEQIKAYERHRIRRRKHSSIYTR